MEDYVLLRKQEKIQEEEKNKMVNDGADQPVQTESQDEALERKKGRGPTLMNNVYTRRPDEKKIIKLNCELQAIADDDKILSEFKNFLGTLSRQSVPLDCINWRRFPEKRKDELWSFVKVNMKTTLVSFCIFSFHRVEFVKYYNTLDIFYGVCTSLMFKHKNYCRPNMTFLKKEEHIHYALLVLCGGCTRPELRRIIISNMIMMMID